MQHALFAYGTLCLPEVMRLVTGRAFASEDAWLEGYERFRLRRRVYPGMVWTGEGVTRGRLYSGIDPASLDRIDAYEGEPYRRIDVRPRLADGTPVQAVTYVLLESLHHLLGGKDWDEEEFRRRHLRQYLRREV